MLALFERLPRPGFRGRALRVVFVPLVLQAAFFPGLLGGGVFGRDLLEGGILAELRIHELPQFGERGLQDVQALLHLGRHRLLQRHPRDLFHACHFHENQAWQMLLQAIITPKEVLLRGFF